MIEKQFRNILYVIESKTKVAGSVCVAGKRDEYRSYQLYTFTAQHVIYPDIVPPASYPTTLQGAILRQSLLQQDVLHQARFDVVAIPEEVNTLPGSLPLQLIDFVNYVDEVNSSCLRRSVTNEYDNFVLKNKYHIIIIILFSS